jgi:hypothetical protein
MHHLRGLFEVLFVQFASAVAPGIVVGNGGTVTIVLIADFLASDLQKGKKNQLLGRVISMQPGTIRFLKGA